MKLLVTEDEPMMLEALSRGLRKSGYAVDKAADGREALSLFEINEYDLIVLDLSLPLVDGMEVLRTIRAVNQEVKILILSARSEISDRINGLDAGSNDYLVKPFDFHELEARIRCLLHRSFLQTPTLLAIGDLELNRVQRRLLIRQSPVELTNKELSILEYLMVHQGDVISAEQLIEHVWDSEADLFSNSLKFHLSSLKKKLFSHGISKDFIVNLRGQGYTIKNT